jgi:hypothetical protein
MKKLVLLLAVVFSVSLFSCGNANKEAAAADSDSVAPDTTVVADSDSAAAPVDSAKAAPADSAKAAPAPAAAPAK